MDSNADARVLRLWQQQTQEEPIRPLDDIRTKAERLDGRMRRWRVMTLALFILLLMKGALEVWVQTNTVERAGDLLMVAALVYVAFVLVAIGVGLFVGIAWWNARTVRKLQHELDVLD